MKKLTLIILLSLFVIAVMRSQTHITNETPIVLVASIGTNGIVGMELLNTFWDRSEDDILITYPNCKFYKGLLKGKFERKENLIIPSKGTFVTIYTNEQIFSRKSFLSDSQLSVGEECKIGKTKSKVIANQKGELILKIE